VLVFLISTQQLLIILQTFVAVNIYFSMKRFSAEGNVLYLKQPNSSPYQLANKTSSHSLSILNFNGFEVSGVHSSTAECSHLLGCDSASLIE